MSTAASRTFDRKLRIVYLTAGGAGMFCGSCMHDNTLARTLHELGHDVVLLPAFTPIRTDEEDVSEQRVVYGGVNVYMSQLWPGWSRLPCGLRRLFDTPRFLEWISARALETRREDDGLLALSMLRGSEGNHHEEARRLSAELVALNPDVVVLTNLLLAGFVPLFKELSPNPDLRVLVTLQGDDIFLDTLPQAQRDAVLAQMREVNRSVDAFVVMSAYYRDFMADLLHEAPERFRIVPLGIAPSTSFTPLAPTKKDRSGPRTVAYLSRICPEKGFDLLIDAFLRLREEPDLGDVRLRFTGWLGQAQQGFFQAQRARLLNAGLGDAFDFVETPDRESKIAFLQSADAFTVPARYREPKGLPVLEALACGTPVVQPAHGAYPELLDAVGGGRLFPPGDARALAEALADLLRDDAERFRLGADGQRRVLERFDAQTMARHNLEMYRSVLSAR